MTGACARSSPTCHRTTAERSSSPPRCGRSRSTATPSGASRCSSRRPSSSSTAGTGRARWSATQTGPRSARPWTSRSPGASPRGATLARVGGFADHLNAPVGRGHLPDGAATGAAGGAACGDLVRVSVAVENERVADAGFDASGCGATLAAGSAAVSLVGGRTLLDALRVGPDDIAAELGGLSPGKRHAAELAADALARALGAAARADARLAPAPGRVLVAMSGGVDSAVAALLETRAGSEVAAVTLELWADPANDGERSCCSAQ